MALIHCPACGRPVSDKAVRCPNCGEPINIQGYRTTGPRPVSYSRDRKIPLWVWLVLGGVCALAAAGAIVYFLFHGKDEPLSFPDRVESFVNQVERDASTFDAADWSNISLKFDSLSAEYKQVYKDLSIEDLDRVDDAIELYHKVYDKYQGTPQEDDLKIVVDGIEYAYKTPTTSQLHQWRSKYASTCSAKLRNMDCQNYTIPNDMRENHPCLVYLVLRSRSLSEEETVQDWFNLYPMMDEEQIDKLYDILYREAYSLGSIDKKYAIKGQINQLNQEAYEHAKSGDFYEAYLLINKAIALSPDTPALYDSKGEFYLMQGRMNKALASWNKVMELNPDFLDDYNGHTNLYDGLVAKGLITAK